MLARALPHEGVQSYQGGVLRGEAIVVKARGTKLCVGTWIGHSDFIVVPLDEF